MAMPKHSGRIMEVINVTWHWELPGSADTAFGSRRGGRGGRRSGGRCCPGGRRCCSGGRGRSSGGRWSPRCRPESRSIHPIIY